MLLLIFPQGTTSPSLDVANAVADAAYRLGLQGTTELQAGNAYVTPAELYQWADEGAKRLSYDVGLFINYDTSVTVTPGTAVYQLPATHVFTLMAAVNGQLLRPTPVAALWALDANWPATSGNARRCSLDAGSVGTITLYPNPVDGGTLGQFCQEFPATIAAGASTVELPAVLQDYFTYRMLAGARGKESDQAMPEMAAHFEQRVELYEQLMAHLWGPGQ